MASLKDLSVKRGEMFFFDPRSIQVDPAYNVRLDSPELREANEELRNNLRSNGFKTTHPLTVRIDGENVVLVAGHRRLSQVLGLIEEGLDFQIVPCIGEQKGTSPEERDLDLLTSNSGLPLSMIEKGEVFKRLQRHGWSLDMIASKSGISTKHVSNLIGLSGAPAEVKALIAEGTVSATTAIKVLASEGETKGTETLVEAVADAKANGKAKATAKTMGSGIQKVAGMSYLDSILAADGLTPNTNTQEDVPAEVLTTQMRHGFARPRITPAKFQAYWETLCELTQLDDVGIIQTMIQEVLAS